MHVTVPPRPDSEVMREQFDYLMQHRATHTPEVRECLECARLHELAITLKWPFRSSSIRSLAFHYRKARHA